MKSGPTSFDRDSLVLDGEAGTVVIAANQPGNNNWLPAEPVVRSVEILSDALFRDGFEPLALELNRVRP